MDMRSRYLALINLLMFVLGLGLAVFVVSLGAQEDADPVDEQDDPGRSFSMKSGQGPDEFRLGPGIWVTPDQPAYPTDHPE